jgi:hypothetical protein
VQHLRNLERSKMSKRDLGRQREDRILVAEEKFFTKLKTSHEEVLGILQITWVILPFLNTYVLGTSGLNIRTTFKITLYLIRY